MSGSFQRSALALAVLAFLSGGGTGEAEMWRASNSLHACPVQRLDAGAPALHFDAGSAKSARIAPGIDEPPMMDAPTRTGFDGTDRFVCCHQGAADYESCEITDLTSGETRLIVLDGEEPDWLGRLHVSEEWSFDDLSIVWKQYLSDETTRSSAALRHDPSGTSVPLGITEVAELGALRVAGVRISPDGARLALIRHSFRGEESDFYPVTIFSLREIAAQAYAEGARHLRLRAEDAERKARSLQAE